MDREIAIWDSIRKDPAERLKKAAPLIGEGKILPQSIALLEALMSLSGMVEIPRL